jgi:hypothetical protein
VGRDCQADLLGGFQIDDQLEFRGLFDGKIGGLRAIQERTKDTSIDLILSFDKADVAIKRPRSQVVGAACAQSRPSGAGSLPFPGDHDCTHHRNR